MSERRPALIALALLATLGAAASAQEAVRWRDSVAALKLRREALLDSLPQPDSALRTIARGGDLVVAAATPLEREALELFRRVEEVRARWFGTAAGPAGGFRIRLDVVVRRDGMTGREETAGLVLSGLPDSGDASRVTRRASRRDAVQQALNLYGELEYARTGTMALWLDLVPPLSLDPEERQRIAMYALATGTGRAQRACLRGSGPDCAYALGLGAPAREEPGGAYHPFLRTDLLLTALELGGPQAWSRLLSAEGEPAARLAAAAGLPLDALATRWTAILLAHRPGDPVLAPAPAGLALAWSVVLLAAALGAARWA